MLAGTMARPLRLEFAGALYHLTSRGNEQRPIFRSDRDRIAFLTFLGIAVRRFGWSVTAYVLMTNHFHLVINTPEPTLSRGMKGLEQKFVQHINRRYERVGPLFQGRFKHSLVEGGSHLLTVLRYVALNPVRAQMVKRPEDCRWSGYRWLAGCDKPSDWYKPAPVLASFGNARGCWPFVKARLQSAPS